MSMTHGSPLVGDDHAEDHVDDRIRAYVDVEHPVSFFLFAGAGSGKTRSLVKALVRLREGSGEYLRLRGRRVGVITYTNAACDEIKRRLEFDPLVEVSTIHSFVWSLIGGFHADIKQWLQTNLMSEIAELEDLQRRGRAGTRIALERAESIKSKTKRLESLCGTRRFTYSPSGDNIGRDSLSHAEVIKMGADFLVRKPLMQRVLISKFPILLIDESQDTNGLLMDAFLKLQEEHKERLCLGLLGDTMQRIYADGKPDLGRHLPPGWATPAKKLNHRCPRRIIKLINKIRSSVDDQVQVPRTDSKEGFVRLFILGAGTVDKAAAEAAAAAHMAAITGDPLWSGSDAEVKKLLLEHHMAANRMGFLAMFEPLYRISSLQTGVRDGSLPGLRLFSDLVLPLVQAKRRGDEIGATAIVRKASPLLSKAAMRAASADQRSQVSRARDAVNELVALTSTGSSPRFLDVLKCVDRTGLFEIPDCLRPIASLCVHEDAGPQDNRNVATPLEDRDPVLDAWYNFLLTPFVQIEPYSAYISGEAIFTTHQGVKGLEFPRVMVVIDDAEARGFMFSYEKLFGAKDKSKTDLENERDGKETSIDRTRRLLYVTCSRAKESLAMVAYSSQPDRIRDYVVQEGWFEEGEVQMLA